MKNMFHKLLLEDTTDAMDIFSMEKPEEVSEKPEMDESSMSENDTTEETLNEAGKYFNEAIKEIEELKVKYPETTHSKIAKALDDITAAIEVARHHIEDIEEDL